MRLAIRQRVRLAITRTLVFAAVATGVLISDSMKPQREALAQGESAQRNFWEERKNLKVLPKDIPAAELRGIMVGAAQGLGVRCWFCHVGEEEQELSTFDFASDEKKHKAVAREMFTMVMEINRGPMSRVAELNGKDEAMQVRCVTCHRGEPEPKLEPRATGQ